MKKTIALLLTLILLLSVFASCNKNSESNGTDQQTSEINPPAASDEAPTTDENGYLLDSLGRMDFGGQVIRISAWHELTVGTLNEFNPSSTAKDAVSRAVYSRNRTVEDRLKVYLEYDTSKEGWLAQNKTEQLAAVRTARGTRDYEIVATYSWTTCSMMLEGLLADLSKTELVDISAPWWESRMLETNSVYGGLYFLTGDISPSLVGQTYCVFFNKTIANATEGIPDLYQLVRDKKWTLDEMMSLSKLAEIDRNSDSVKDKTDQFGFVSEMTSLDAFYQGSGLLTIEKGEDGSVIMSPDYGSDKTIGLVDKLREFVSSSAAFVTKDNVYISAWRKGNALFHLNVFNDAKFNIANDLKNFGVLPVPLYNGSQEEYITTPGFYYTMYGITVPAKGDPAVAATLEALASESYRGVIPVYYDDILQLQASETSEDNEMWEYIRSGLVIDPGRVFCYQFGFLSGTWWPFRSAIYNNDTWATWYEGVKENIPGKVADMNTKMLEFIRKQ